MKPADLRKIKDVSTIANIWINMGNKNPYGEMKADKTAKKIADLFAIEIPEPPSKWETIRAVIAWVKANRPALLRTAAMRHRAKKKAKQAKELDRLIKSQSRDDAKTKASSRYKKDGRYHRPA